MERLRDWSKRLDVAMRQTYEDYDDGIKCGFFAADCIKAVTGVDLAQDWRKRPMAAMALIEEYEEFIFNLVESYGFEYIEPSTAQRGDLIAYDKHGMFTVGIVDLSGRSFAVPDVEGNVRHMPMKWVKHAWRVG